jgi:hypothetical protein
MPARKWFEILDGATLPSLRVEGIRILEIKNPNGPLRKRKTAYLLTRPVR